MSAVSLLLAAIAPIVQSVGEYEHWRLSFDAKVEGEHVIENYPQYEKLFFCGPYAARSYGQPLANWSVTFTDRDGKTVRQAPNWNAFYTTVLKYHARAPHHEINDKEKAQYIGHKRCFLPLYEMTYMAEPELTLKQTRHQIDK